MRKILFILSLLPSLLLAQNTYYVATDGNDANAGTLLAPWKTWQHATDLAVPGDTVYIRGGVYHPQSRISTFLAGAWRIDSSSNHGRGGTAESWIYYFNYPGETPILDCSQMDNFGQNFNIGLAINQAEFIHFRGLTIRNVWQQDEDATSPEAWGVASTYSANLIFENMTVHNIGGRGWWYQGGAWTEGDSIYAVDSTGTDPANAKRYCLYDTVQWINCDTYDICDSIDYTGAGDPGNSGDGWKSVHYGGNVVIFKGCRAWNYTDDGWDPSLSARDLNNIGPTVIMDSCWAMASNKYTEFCTVYADSGKEGIEGNGIKFGAITGDTSAVHPAVYVFNSLAMFCVNAGFLQNIEINGYSKWDAGGRYYNNTSYYNKADFDIQNINEMGRNLAIRNSIAYVHTDDKYAQYLVKIMYPSIYDESNNTWDATQLTGGPSYSTPWVMTDTVTINDADFVTVDSTILARLFAAPRNTDGSLHKNPMRLVAGSDLIDMGLATIPAKDSLSIYLAGTPYESYSKPYAGSAPDIGAYEYDAAYTFNDSTDITGFTVGSRQVGEAVINDTAHTVDITVTYGTNVANMRGTVTLPSKAMVSPESGTLQNFTSPVSYSVLSESAQVQAWTVTITVADPLPIRYRHASQGSKSFVWNGKLIK